MVSIGSAQVSANLHDWAAGLSDVGLRSLGFTTPKFKIYERLTEMGLKTRNYLSMPVDEFLKSGRKKLDALGGKHFYVIAENDTGTNLYSEPMLTKDELWSRISCHKEWQLRGAKRITVIEETPIRVEGNFIVNQNGEVTGEFARWNGRSISRGREPEMRIGRAPFCTHLKMSAASDVERSLMQRMVKVIPRIEVTSSAFLPGYYEIVVCGDAGEPERILFHDFRDSPPFVDRG